MPPSLTPSFPLFPTTAEVTYPLARSNTNWVAKCNPLLAAGIEACVAWADDLSGGCNFQTL